MTLKIAQLGLGQQGVVNLKSLEALSGKCDFEIVAVADLDHRRIDAAAEKFSMLHESRIYRNGPVLIGSEIPSGIDVVLDSTHTPAHKKNIVSAIDGLAEGYKLRVWAGEKPVLGSHDDPTAARDLGMQLSDRGVALMENIVELYSPVATATINDIAKQNGRAGLRISTMEYVRGGDVRGKCVETQRNLFGKFGGAWSDKAPHDVSKSIATWTAANGVAPVLVIPDGVDDIEFSLTEAILPDGSKGYFSRDGPLVRSKSPTPINESYAKVGLQMGGTSITMVSSFVPLPQSDVSMLDGWMPTQMKKELRGRLDVDPRLTWEKAGNWQETRAERIVTENGDGERTVYVAETYGTPFAAKQTGTEAEILFAMPDAKDYNSRKAGWHTRYVEEALGVALGESRPRVGLESILTESYILNHVAREGYLRALRANRCHTLDLRTDPELAALMNGGLEAPQQATSS